MNRRNFFGVAGATAAVMSLPLTVKANDEQVALDVGIAKNHGHGLNLNIAQVVEMFSETVDGQTATLDIQGESGHPHTINLSQDQLVELMATKELEVVSSLDAGHTHGVSITLEIIS